MHHAAIWGKSAPGSGNSTRRAPGAEGSLVLGLQQGALWPEQRRELLATTQGLEAVVGPRCFSNERGGSRVRVSR